MPPLGPVWASCGTVAAPPGPEGELRMRCPPGSLPALLASSTTVPAERRRVDPGGCAARKFRGVSGGSWGCVRCAAVRACGVGGRREHTRCCPGPRLGPRWLGGHWWATVSVCGRLLRNAPGQPLLGGTGAFSVAGNVGEPRPPGGTLPAAEEFDAFYARVFGPLVGKVFLVTGDLHEAQDIVQGALSRAG